MQICSSTSATRSRIGSRRGVATVWAILTLPIAAIAICGIVELGHLCLVRQELQTALEAAALAGVKTWADQSRADGHAQPGAREKTQAARQAALAVARANTVFGESLALDANQADDGDDVNGYDNATCAGDIVLGGFETSSSSFFTTNASVGCGRRVSQPFEAQFEIEIDTGTAPGLNPSTLDTPNAFRVRFVSSTFPGPLSITQLQINLRNLPSEGSADGNAVFDFGTIGQFASSPTEGTGNGPAIHSSSEVIATDLLGATGDGTGVLTLALNEGAWTVGQTLVFGVDTDFVETNGFGPDTARDTGGDFGDLGGVLGGVGRMAVSFGFNGDTAAANVLQRRLQWLGPAQSRLGAIRGTIDATVQVDLPNQDFAVFAQKSLTVTPLCQQLFGVTLPPLTVTSRAVATARCAGSGTATVLNPQLVHVSGWNCP